MFANFSRLILMGVFLAVGLLPLLFGPPFSPLGALVISTVAAIAVWFVLVDLPNTARARLTIAVSALIVLLIPGLASAQDGSSVIQVGGGLWSTLLPYVNEVLGVLITGLIGWVALVIKSKVGLDIDAKNREALHSAAMTGVNAALSKLGGVVGGLTISTKSAVIGAGVNWVLASVPDAVAYFDLTPDKLRDLVAAKLNIVATAQTTTATADQLGASPAAAATTG